MTRIDTLRALETAATPGIAYVVRAESAGVGGDPYGGWLVWRDRLYLGDLYHEKDAEYLTTLLNAAPALLDVVEAARAVSTEGGLAPMRALRAALARLEATE